MTLMTEAAGFRGTWAEKSARSTKSSKVQSESAAHAVSRFVKSLTILMHSTQDGKFKAIDVNQRE
jgi:hypothetical protein